MDRTFAWRNHRLAITVEQDFRNWRIGIGLKFSRIAGQEFGIAFGPWCLDIEHWRWRGAKSRAQAEADFEATHFGDSDPDGGW